MASVNLTKLIGRLQLNNGTDSDGNVKYVAVGLGNLNENLWDDDDSPVALLAVVTALEPCLSKTVGRVELVATNTVTNA